MITLRQQADAVERAAVNLKGHADNLAGLVKLKKRPEIELTEVRRWLPMLQAAALTMREVAEEAAGAKS